MRKLFAHIRNLAMYRIDKSAEAAYQALVRLLHHVSSIFVAPYQFAPDYEIRLKGSVRAEKILQRARNRRTKYGIPFWDAVILEGMTTGPIDESILDGALYHQSTGETLLEVSRNDVLGIGIVATVEKAGIPYPWAVLSRVRADDGTEYHFPMLDFRCPISEANLMSLQRVAERLLDCPWVLIESECSYHLLGASLLSDRELAKFFGASILFGPLVDRNYVAHQLLNGSGALRIVSVAGKTGLKTRVTTFPHNAWGDSSQLKSSAEKGSDGEKA